MGHKPSTNHTIVAMTDTAKMENNDVKYPAAKEVILKNTYRNNTFRVAPDLFQLLSIIKDFENICKQGGFFFKY